MNETMNKTAKELSLIECERQMAVVRFSSCGKYLFAGGYDAAIHRWEVTAAEPQSLPSVAGHHGWVQWIEFQPAGELLFSVDTWGRLQATRYAQENPKVVWSQEQAHDGWIRALSVSTDGSLVATGGRDQAARVWSAQDGKLLHEFADHPQEVYAVAISPEQDVLVTGDLLGVLRCWDLKTGKCIREHTMEGMHYYDRIQDVGGLRILRFHEENTLLCAGAHPQKAGRAIAIPTVHWLAWPSLEVQHTAQFGPDKQGFVFDFAWHPEGYWAIVTSGTPGTGQFLFLNPQEEKPFFLHTKLSNCHSVAVHSDGRLAIAGTNRRSQGNGAVTDEEGNYLGNFSPIHLFAPADEEVKT